MSIASTKETVRAGIVGIASSSFLVGLFLMLGLFNWQHYQPLWYAGIGFVGNIVAGAVTARRVLRAVS